MRVFVGAILVCLVLTVAAGWRPLSRWWSSTAEWRTPMEFFGRVIDDQTNPVAHAEASFCWTDLSFKGNSTWTNFSDKNGLFTLPRTKGKNLIVTVSKDGYYAYAPYGMAFNYAGENVNFVANRTNPVIFRLKRKGIAEPLIHIKSNYGINTAGLPLELSLSSGKAVERDHGDLRVECWAEGQGGTWKYDWRCRITVVQGGLQRYTNEFPFQAPLNGYEGFEEINMPMSLGDKWGNSAKRSYFLHLANGNYGRMNFEIIPWGDHFFELDSYVNSFSSRNLEFDPSKILQPPN